MQNEHLKYLICWILNVKKTISFLIYIHVVSRLEIIGLFGEKPSDIYISRIKDSQFSFTEKQARTLSVHFFKTFIVLRHLY